MHKSVARAERNAVASSCCKRHIFWLVFWQIPCRHQTTAALCIRAGAKRNEAKRSQRNQINLFKNSDQIRICRRFIVYYCYYNSVASIREIDFDGFFVYSSLSLPLSLCCPFLSFGTQFLSGADQTDTNHDVYCARALAVSACLFAFFSSFVNYFIMNLLMCGIFWSFRCACDSLSPHAFDFINVFIFVTCFELDRTQWMCADSYSNTQCASKRVSLSTLEGIRSTVPYVCVYSCHVNRQFWRIINSVVAFKKHSTNEKPNGTKSKTKTEINKSFISFDFSWFRLIVIDYAGAAVLPLCRTFDYSCWWCFSCVQHAYVSRKWRSSACYRSHQISIIRWWFLNDASMHIWFDCHLTFLKLVLMDCCVHSFSATFFFLHRTFVHCIHADVVVHMARLPQALTIHDNSQRIYASIDFWSSDHSVHLYVSVSGSHLPRQRAILCSRQSKTIRKLNSISK